MPTTTNAKNATIENDGSTLTIVVDLTKQVGPSSSGKSLVIATTAGSIDAGDGIKVGLNVYRPR